MLYKRLISRISRKKEGVDITYIGIINSIDIIYDEEFFKFSKTLVPATLYRITTYEINNINTSFSGYIPQFKYKYNNIDDVHDFSLIYSCKFIYDVKNSINESKTYRSYLKYSYKDKFSAQIGLQKISFGNSLILRPLNWFDTLDYRTVADHTQGVDAIKLNYYFHDSLC